VFFIDDDYTLESMWFLADQTFLTCCKGRELGPVRDLAVGVVEPVMCLGSKLKIEQRTISAVFFKTGFWARGFLSSALNFGGVFRDWLAAKRRQEVAGLRPFWADRRRFGGDLFYLYQPI
jgi:hypothetical protein